MVEEQDKRELVCCGTNSIFARKQERATDLYSGGKAKNSAGRNGGDEFEREHACNRDETVFANKCKFLLDFMAGTARLEDAASLFRKRALFAWNRNVANVLVLLEEFGVLHKPIRVLKRFYAQTV